MLNPMIAVFVVLQVADMVTTLFGLAVGAVEQNLVAASFFELVGPALGVPLYKLAAVAVVISLLVWIQRRWAGRRLHWHVLTAANLLYFFVVTSNLLTIAAVK